MSIVRVAFAGSVDDGKSTLFGRLVHDLGAYYRDELEHVIAASEQRGFARTELALLTDGLRAEREQGITIDVAHRTVHTARRRLLFADAPGHVEYTRNMVTAASSADVAVLLVDARRGLTEQSRRHLAIAALLRVGTLIVCVNKMDRVDFDEARFTELLEMAKAHVHAVAQAEYGVSPSVLAVPVSALHGDNVAASSTRTPYYQGPPLLTLLEEAECSLRDPRGPLRVPVQWVLRPQSDEHEDYRGYAARIARGSLAAGQEIESVRSGRRSRVTTLSAQRPRAVAGDSVVLQLEDDIDLSRGDVLFFGARPHVRHTLELTAIGLGERAWTSGDSIRLKHGTRTSSGRITAGEVSPNEQGRLSLQLDEPLAYDAYASDRCFGAAVLIDPTTHATVAACLLREPAS